MLNDLRDTFGFKIPEIFGAGGVTTPQGDAVIAAMPTAPDSDRQKLIQTLVWGLIRDDIWSKLDVLYLTAAHAADSSLLNWINPGTHDLTVVNLIAGLFEIDRGWTGNGVNGYLDTNYAPSINGVNYTLDDASFGIYIRTDVDENRKDMGTNQAANDLNLTSRDGNNVKFRVNSSLSGTVANLDSRGFYIANRVLATHQDLYKNSVRIVNHARISTGLANIDLYILCFNDEGVAGDFATHQIAEAHVGGGMTQTNVNNFTDRLVTFLTTIGAAV